MLKFGVVILPGSNCDHDTLYVLKHIYQQDTVALWHKSTDLQGCDVIIVPGGFSYGDYLRAGALSKYAPIMKEVTLFSNKGGYVVGICNGFQILCEAGLLPGALLLNTQPHSGVHYACRNIHMIAQNYSTLLTNRIPKGKVLTIPIAHGEGRYFADEATLERLNKNGQIILKYCNEKGEITTDSNPNGSLENIAGICNETKNVYGLMPHPERASDEYLGNTDGKYILTSLIKTVEARKREILVNQ